LGKAGGPLWTVWIQEEGFPIGMHRVLGGLEFGLVASRNMEGDYI
jgi:hypothetical protein